MTRAGTQSVCGLASMRRKVSIANAQVTFARISALTRVIKVIKVVKVIEDVGRSGENIQSWTLSQCC